MMVRLVITVLLAASATGAPKSIVELQPFRTTDSAPIRIAGKEGTATLVNLNPSSNSWYLYSVVWNNGAAEQPWHLENPAPREATLVLDRRNAGTLIIKSGGKQDSCGLFSGASTLQQGRESRLIYYPLCGGRVYLRNPAKGQRTALEASAEFLRNQVWGGEKIIVFFHHLMADRYRETAAVQGRAESPVKDAAQGGPLPALMNAARAQRIAIPEGLGVRLQMESTAGKSMDPGTWYPAADKPGVRVSVMQPSLIQPGILDSFPRLVTKLDTVEAASLVYLIAFELDQFDIGFARGTEYPGVGWSDRVLPQVRDARLPGPDGIGNIAPLVATGLIPPADGKRTVAAFTGGFKRTHGAFRYGDLATVHQGSHYGFVENGVVFSRLQPGLATMVVRDNGRLEMKTWSEADNGSLAGIRHARQNGVPLVETDASRATVPGALVSKWGPGNWSGSEDARLRTIRAGAAIHESHGKRYLIYAVFSSATPAAMARVFHAYQCSYAMLLDMNALEHTYLAVYRRSGSEMSVDHLIKGMSQLDKSAAGQIVPRFLGYPDNRDFFYVMSRRPEVQR